MFVDKDSGAELEVIDRQQLIEWFATNYKRFGTTLEFITDRSQVRLVLSTFLNSDSFCVTGRFSVLQRFRRDWRSVAISSRFLQ